MAQEKMRLQYVRDLLLQEDIRRRRNPSAKSSALYVDLNLEFLIKRECTLCLEL